MDLVLFGFFLAFKDRFSLLWGPKRWPSFYIWAAKKADFLYKTILQPQEAMLASKWSLKIDAASKRFVMARSACLIFSLRARFTSMNVCYPKGKHLDKLLLWFPSIIITEGYIHHNTINPLWKYKSKIKWFLERHHSWLAMEWSQTPTSETTNSSKIHPTSMHHQRRHFAFPIRNFFPLWI